MIHLQVPVPNWLEAVRLLPDNSLVKAVDQGQVFNEVKAINSRVFTCLRHHYDPHQVFGGSLEENKAKARVFFDSFIDETFLHSIAPHCDFVEEWNEYLANSQNASEMNDRLNWAEAAADVWESEYRTRPELYHIRLVLCNTAVGNWIPEAFFITAKTYDAVVGYHPYTHCYYGTRSALDWPDFSGLFNQMEMHHGIEVDWLFTEAGPFESALTGWRSRECLNSSIDSYVEVMRDWIQDVKTTAAYKGGRIYGFALFTTGRAGSTWKHFYTEQPELNQLAEMIAAEWQPSPPAPSPNPQQLPAPRPGCGQPRFQYKRTYNVIPETATEAEAAAIFRDAWSRSRETVGGSYDDAGLGDLDSRIARLYGINPVNRPLYQTWFSNHYPDTQILFSDIPEASHQPPATRPNPLGRIPNLIWPVANSCQMISEGGRFNDHRKYGNGLHEGIDLFAEEYNPILAAASGVVVWADCKRRSDGNPSDYGNYVIVDHGQGIFTWYAHLASLSVIPGSVVLQADILGEAGSTGCGTGTHLHFALQYIGYGLPGYVIPDVLDPTPYIQPKSL